MGQIFEDNGVKLEVVEVKTFFCDGCYYQSDECELLHGDPHSKKISGQCSKNHRDDRKNIIFKEIK
jgi:hypothetical protein